MTALLPAKRSAEETSFQVKGFSPPIELSLTRHLKTTLGTASPSERGVVWDIFIYQNEIVIKLCAATLHLAKIVLEKS